MVEPEQWTMIILAFSVITLITIMAFKLAFYGRKEREEREQNETEWEHNTITNVFSRIE